VRPALSACPVASLTVYPALPPRSLCPDWPPRPPRAGPPADVLPLVLCPLWRCPPDSWLPGPLPAPLATGPAAGTRSISTPLSARMVWAPWSPTPGRLARHSPACGTKGSAQAWTSARLRVAPRWRAPWRAAPRARTALSPPRCAPLSRPPPAPAGRARDRRSHTVR